jgi:hypothetical protein
MSGKTYPLTHFEAVTPNDSGNLPGGQCRAVYLGVTGNLAITEQDGTVTLFFNLAAGIIHPIEARQIRATGTTATNMLAGY